MRTIRVIRPAGGKVVQFEASNDLTWEGLEPMLIDLGIATQNVQIIVSGSGNAINTSPASKIPDGNIMLGIKQTKLPFGAGYTEMRDLLKDRRAKALVDRDQATLDLIGNYTQKNLDQLTEVYNQLVSEVSVSVVDATEVNQLKDRVTNLEAQVVELRRRINDLEESVVVDEEDDDEDLYQDDEDDDDGMTDEDRAFVRDFNLV